MAIPESIKQKANKIRNEVYGKDVREALASGIEEAGDIADQTRERQDSVEAQFQSVLDETTGKDVISAPEITAARVGADDTNHPNLKERLDTEYQKLSSQLAQTIEQMNTEKINAKYPPIPIIGLKGDGSDETSVLQNLLNLFTTGGTLYIPKGVYKISSSLIAPKNVSLEGDGIETLIESVIGISEPFQMLKLSRNDENYITHIKNIAFNQKRRENNFIDDQVNSVIIPRNNVVFEKVFITNTVSSGIASSNGVENIKIKNCFIDETGHHPVYFSSDGSFNYIRNIDIINSSLGTPAHISDRAFPASIIKFRLGKSGDILENVNIKGNLMGTPSTNSIVIYFSSSGGGGDIFRNINIENNNINPSNEKQNVIDVAIYFGSNSKGENINIIRNVINGNSTALTENTYGIRLLCDADTEESILLEGNKISGFSVDVNANNALLKNNTFNFIKNGCQIISGGTVDNNTFISTYDNAVAIYRSQTNTLKNKIRLTGQATVGIEIRDLINRTVSNNEITATEPVKRSPGGTIKNNEFNHNLSEGQTYVGFNDQTHIDNKIDGIRTSYNSLRPSNPKTGELIYDMVLKKYITYNGTTWTDLLGTVI